MSRARRGRTDILRPCGQTHCHGGHAGHRFIAYIIFGADLIRGGRSQHCGLFFVRGHLLL